MKKLRASTAGRQSAKDVITVRAGCTKKSQAVNLKTASYSHSGLEVVNKMRNRGIKQLKITVCGVCADKFLRLGNARLLTALFSHTEVVTRTDR